MSTRFPGTTIEVISLEKGSSRQLFRGIFASGGITLSQVCIMTGLEPYLVQNWVKRGFLSSPVKRMYSKEQFARIIIINMLRESLQIERICGLIKIISGVLEDTSDDLISDDELYHRYVDMIAEGVNINDRKSVIKASEKAAEEFAGPNENSQGQLIKLLQAMLYAHTASILRGSAEEILSTLE